MAPVQATWSDRYYNPRGNAFAAMGLRALRDRRSEQLPDHGRISASMSKLMLSMRGPTFCTSLLACLLSGFVVSSSAFADRAPRGTGAVFGIPERVAPGRAADQREMQQDEEQRRRRLSQQERQQLRRDIDEAGRDIYRRPVRNSRDN